MTDKKCIAAKLTTRTPGANARTYTYVQRYEVAEAIGWSIGVLRDLDRPAARIALERLARALSIIQSEGVVS
jgi:hypothetical protein